MTLKTLSAMEWSELDLVQEFSLEGQCSKIKVRSCRITWDSPQVMEGEGGRGCVCVCGRVIIEVPMLYVACPCRSDRRKPVPIWWCGAVSVTDRHKHTSSVCMCVSVCVRCCARCVLC